MMLSPLTFTTSLARPLITVDGKGHNMYEWGIFFISGFVFPEIVYCDRHHKLNDSSKFEMANKNNTIVFD